MQWSDEEARAINVMREIGGWTTEHVLDYNGISIDLVDQLVKKGAVETRLFQGVGHEKDGGAVEWRLVDDTRERTLSAMMFLENAMAGQVICQKAVGLDPMGAVRVAHHLLQGPHTSGFRWAMAHRARCEAEYLIECYRRELPPDDGAGGQ